MFETHEPTGIYIHVHTLLFALWLSLGDGHFSLQVYRQLTDENASSADV